MANLKTKGYVCVCVDPVTQKRTWLPLENVIIRDKNNQEHKLGDLLNELEENKVNQVEFDTFKLQTKKPKARSQKP